MSKQITEISEEKYLHGQPVRVFLPFDDLIDPNDEKVIDGELHIRHIDGEFRKVSLRMVTKLFLEARLAAVQVDDDDDEEECDCPVCRAAQETLPTHLTVKEYAEEYGIVLQGGSAEMLTVQAAGIAARKGHPVPSGSLYALKFAREVLAEVFDPILNKH